MATSILFLNLYTFSLTGGIEKVCRSIVKWLDDSCTANLITPYTQSMYDEEVDLKYTRSSKFEYFSGKRIQFGLMAFIKGLSSDVILLSHINLLVFARLIKFFKPRARIILMAHGIEVWGPLNRWKTKFLRTKTEIWAVSTYTSKCLQENHGIHSENIAILNNCLDPYFEAPTVFTKPAYLLARYGLKENQPIIFSICRLSSAEKYKGYDLTILAIKELISEFPNIHYIIGGKADEGEKKRIENLIEESGLENHVSLIGFIKDEELIDHYLISDVFVMPSKGEGFGISFIEAAACGRKSVAGNLDGSADALINGQLGELINPNNIEEITAAIKVSLSNPISNSSNIQANCLVNFSFESYQSKVNQLVFKS